MLFWERIKKNKLSWGEFTSAMKAVTHFVYFLEGAIQKRISLSTFWHSKSVQVKSTWGEKNLGPLSPDYFEGRKGESYCALNSYTPYNNLTDTVS